MTTLTKFDENKINIADNISYIVINFNTYQDVISFEARMLSKILYYKDMDTFDKSIFKLKSFKSPLNKKCVCTSELPLEIRELIWSFNPSPQPPNFM